jgi:hypothetical protein
MPGRDRAARPSLSRPHFCRSQGRPAGLSSGRHGATFATSGSPRVGTGRRSPRRYRPVLDPASCLARWVIAGIAFPRTEETGESHSAGDPVQSLRSGDDDWPGVWSSFVRRIRPPRPERPGRFGPPAACDGQPFPKSIHRQGEAATALVAAPVVVARRGGWARVRPRVFRFPFGGGVAGRRVVVLPECHAAFHGRVCVVRPVEHVTQLATTPGAVDEGEGRRHPEPPGRRPGPEGLPHERDRDLRGVFDREHGGPLRAPPELSRQTDHPVHAVTVPDEVVRARRPEVVTVLRADVPEQIGGLGNL